MAGRRKARGSEAASSPAASRSASPRPSKRAKKARGKDGAEPAAAVGAGADSVEQAVDDPGVSEAVIQAWLPRQQCACAALLAGGKPDLPPRTAAMDPHKERLLGLEEQYSFVRATVADTLLRAMSNSLAIIGTSGTGKHALLEATLDSVTEELAHSKVSHVALGAKPSSAAQRDSLPFYHVRLDGASLPTDRLCLRALVHQLVEQGAFDEAAVADVLQDHAAEEAADKAAVDEDDEEEQRLDPIDMDGHLDDEDEEEVDDDDSVSGESDNVLGPKVQQRSQQRARKGQQRSAPQPSEQEQAELHQSLYKSISTATNTIIGLLSTPVMPANAKASSSATVMAKPLVISLSNFQSIVTREPQALLYCLLDAVQAASYAPGLLVVGFSTRLDIAELMEKRVKSRFSHRFAQIYALPNVPDDKQTDTSKSDRLRERVTSGKDDEAASSATVLDLVRKVMLAPIPVVKGERAGDRAAWLAYWTQNVEDLLADATFRGALRAYWNRTTNVAMLQRILRPVVASLQASDAPLLDAGKVCRHFADWRMNATEAMIRSLTLAQLTMLITAKHIHTQGRTNFNFEMCWDELRRWLGVQAEYDSARTAGLIAAASSAAMGSSTPTSQPHGSLPASPYSVRREKGSREDRIKAKHAFKSLLELEIFLPDAAARTMNMTSLAGGLGGLSASRKGSLLRDELVPVQCLVEVGSVTALVKEMVERGEGGPGVNQRLLNWARSSGI